MNAYINSEMSIIFRKSRSFFYSDYYQALVSSGFSNAITEQATDIIKEGNNKGFEGINRRGLV